MRARSLLSLLPLLVSVLAAFGLGFGASGCDRDGIPPLVEVTEVTPRALEVGDRLEIRGSGFPQGRVARVTFRGSLLRPGRAEQSAAVVEAEGVVGSSDRIEVVVTDTLEESFCGRGDHAVHTTMRGDIEVAFRSNNTGAPPLVGVMHGLTLDVTPSSVRAAVVESRANEGARVLAFLGIVVGPASPRGLPIEKVAPGSPADLSGFQPGDVIAAVDGVHVHGLGDVVPASSRAARITVRHGDSGTDETKTVPMVGYASERIPVEYGPALLVVGLALAVLVLLVLPAPVVASELELRVARRLRATGIRALALALLGRGPRAIVSVLASILIATFALGPHVIAADLDGVILLLLAIGLLVASRVAMARGLRASLKAAADVGVFGLVLALATAGIVIQGGALRLAEVTRSQGSLPWEFAAARHPVAFVLAFAYLAALVAILRPRDDQPVLGQARLTDLATRSAATPPVPGDRLLERLGLIVACALAAVLFFGGWQVAGAWEGHATLREVVSAIVFVLKTWGLAAFVQGVASVASPWTRREARLFFVRRLVPAMVVGCVLVVASRRLAPSESLELAAGATVVAALFLLALRTGLRVRSAMLRPEAHASPFL